MSDIVERLRQVAAAYKSLPTSGIWATMTVDRDASCNNLTDAADEIERLRAEVAGLREDAERYRWLRPRLFSADFDYNENGIVALVFEMPPSTQFWADCDMTVDAARKGVLPHKNCDRPDCPAGGHGPCAPCEREHSGG